MLRKFLQFLILRLQMAYLLISDLNVFVELSEVKKLIYLKVKLSMFQVKKNNCSNLGHAKNATQHS